MRKVETPSQIAARWKLEGKSFRPLEVRAEYQRQAAWAVREREDLILANSPDSEVAESIRDHRACGNWTTQQREAAASDHESVIRQAYRSVERRAGCYVELIDLRAELGDMTRADQDAALLRLYGRPDVYLEPFDMGVRITDFGRLTQADRDAALIVGGTALNMIRIRDPR